MTRSPPTLAAVHRSSHAPSRPAAAPRANNELSFEVAPLSIGPTRPDARLWAIFATGLCLALLAVGRDRMMRDPGTLWHTVVGEDILTTGHITTTDRFSFTFGGKPWLAQQWLGECIMALIHRAAGLDGLLLAACAILAAIYASVATRLQRQGLPTFHAVFITLVVIAASSFHFMPRPHLATIAFTGLTFAILTDVEAGRASPRRLWLLPLIIAVWSNIHGGALGGVAMIGITCAGWIALTLVERCPGPASIATLVFLPIASAAATLINPFGPQLPKLWIDLMSMKSLPLIMVEHAPLQFASPEGIMIGLLGVGYVIACVKAHRAGLRATWVIPVVWFLLALSRIRHGPLFAITAAIALADILPLAIPALRNASEQLAKPCATASSSAITRCTLARQGGMAAASGGHALTPARNQRMLWPLVPALVIALIFTLQCLRIDVPLIGSNWARLSPQNWPVAATDVLREELKSPTANGRVFNALNFGGYLIYKLPDAKIYIDDRCELYGEAGLADYLDLMRNPARFDDVARAQDIQAALIRSKSRLADHLDKSPDWTRKHRDELAAVFVRNSNPR